MINFYDSKTVDALVQFRQQELRNTPAISKQSGSMSLAGADRGILSAAGLQMIRLGGWISGIGPCRICVPVPGTEGECRMV